MFKSQMMVLSALAPVVLAILQQPGALIKPASLNAKRSWKSPSTLQQIFVYIPIKISRWKE